MQPNTQIINFNIEILFNSLAQFLDVNFVDDGVMSQGQKAGYTCLPCPVLRLQQFGFNKLSP